MLKKTIKYTNYFGEEIEEDFYFNLTKAELMEMELSERNGFEAMVKKIIQEKDSKKLISLFKEMILKAYGVRSDDGKRFIKSDQLREEFSQTEAYSNLFVELASDAEAASAFVNGIVPPMPQDHKTSATT